ncbi:MAG: ABC transporter ATP-binding protein [Candidatus Eisenbacteria bacterium]
MATHADTARLEGVRVVAGGTEILTGVDLSLNAGDLAVLVGPNGAGKSTVLRTLVGRIRPTEGRATVGGRDVSELSGVERAGKISWLPQIADVREPIRVLDLVTAGRFRFRESPAASESAARAVLTKFGIGDLAERRWHGLSGGERQRIALATLWVQDAPLLLLDEPANHLDPAHQIETYRWIGEVVHGRAAAEERPRGILCVTHDVDLIGWLAPKGASLRVIGISEGRIRFQLPWESGDIVPALSDLFAVEFEPVDVGGVRRLLVARVGARP